jgi:hypothetical protein
MDGWCSRDPTGLKMTAHRANSTAESEIFSEIKLKAAQNVALHFSKSQHQLKKYQ